MKNFFKFLGIISLALVIGFSMVACGDDEEEGGAGWDGTWKDSDNPAYTVTISGENITITDGSKTLSAKLDKNEETAPEGGIIRKILEGTKEVGTARYIDAGFAIYLGIDLPTSGGNSVFSNYVMLTCEKN